MREEQALERAKLVAVVMQALELLTQERMREQRLRKLMVRELQPIRQREQVLVGAEL